MEEFLKELTELSKKHGIYVHGCGCCPALWDSENNDQAQHLQWDEKNQKYVPEMVL